MNWALVSETTGDWLHLNTSIHAVLDWYVARGLARHGANPELLAYDRNNDETWPAVAAHMWRHDVEIVRIDSPPTLRLARGENVTMDLASIGPRSMRRVRGEAVPVLHPHELQSAKKPKLSIDNTFATEQEDTES